MNSERNRRQLENENRKLLETIVNAQKDLIKT